MRQFLYQSRYRFRKSTGEPDFMAVRTFALAIKHAPDLSPLQKSRLEKHQSRLLKSEEGPLPALSVDGIWIFLDRPKGTVEEGVGPDGTPWKREFLCNYGFFPDTMGADDEPVDVFVGDNYGSEQVWLVKQVFRDGTFDEYKVLLGFKDEVEALRMYFAHVPVWCFGGIRELPKSFLVQLIGCAPETVPLAMQKSSYQPLEKSVLSKLGVPRSALEGAEWSTARVNDLPDSHFLYVESGGQKDSDGKTVPRSLRHFPYKDEQGKIDLPHLRNAIARIPQSGPWLSQADKDRLQEQARKMLDGQTRKTKALCYASLGHRLRKAIEGAAGYNGPTTEIKPGDSLMSHPAITAPITWEYDYPDQVGGFVGGIEPEDESWIALVDVLGHCLLWIQRDANGGVVGAPYTFERPDLATLEVKKNNSTSSSDPQPPPFPPQEKLPSGSVVTQPGQSPVVVKDAVPSGGDSGSSASSGPTASAPVSTATSTSTSSTSGTSTSGTVTSEQVPVKLSEVDHRKKHEHVSKDKYDGLDFTPPKAVKENFKRSLELHEEGYSGDGLKAETLAWARRLSRGEKISPEKARTGAAWFARHESDRKPNWATEKTPGYVAWMAWGGDEGRAWMNKLKRQMDARDEVSKSVGSLIEKRLIRAVEKTITRDDEKHLIFGIVLEPEPFDGNGDAHGHTYSGEEIRNAQYNYLAYYRHMTDNHNHTDSCRENPQFGEGVCTCGAYLDEQEDPPVVIVECYSAPVDMVIEGTSIKKDSWLQRVKVLDDSLWQKVLTGEWNAFSIEGIGDLYPLDEYE